MGSTFASIFAFLVALQAALGAGAIAVGDRPSWRRLLGVGTLVLASAAGALLVAAWSPASLASLSLGAMVSGPAFAACAIALRRRASTASASVSLALSALLLTAWQLVLTAFLLSLAPGDGDSTLGQRCREVLEAHPVLVAPQVQTLAQGAVSLVVATLARLELIDD